VARRLACRIRWRDDDNPEAYPTRTLEQGRHARSRRVRARIPFRGGGRRHVNTIPAVEARFYAPAAARLSSRIASAVDTSSAVVTSGGTILMTVTAVPAVTIMWIAR